VSVYYNRLTFSQMIAYFLAKVNIPTETWLDMWTYEHIHAFTVAGATQAALLADLRKAVEKAITQGTTLQEFRKDFKNIIAKTGWQYNGDFDWRTRVIYGTNVRTAYAAGRWRQLMEMDSIVYLKYNHSHAVKVPREKHLMWDGLVLRKDDPWWIIHAPPNGWGCQCYLTGVSEAGLKRLGKDGPDTPPQDGTYQWLNKSTGEVVDVPVGIDPGWDYNPGEQAA